MKPKSFFVLAFAFILLVAAVFLIWSDHKDNEKNATVKADNSLPHPFLVTSAQGSSISVKIADNKEGKQLKKVMAQKGAITWRCLGLEQKKKDGITYLLTSLTLGGPEMWDGKGTATFKDKVRQLHSPGVTCTLQVPTGVFEVKPMDGVLADKRLVKAMKLILVDLFRRGYGAVLPGQDANTADLRKVSAEVQAKKLQGFEKGSTLTCAVNGVNKGYSVQATKQKLATPKPCQLLIYNDGKSVIWSLRGAAQDNLVIRHAF